MKHVFAENRDPNVAPASGLEQKALSIRDFLANYPISPYADLDHQSEVHEIHEQKIATEAALQRVEPADSTELKQLFIELNSLIGLQRVKEEIYQLIQFVRIQAIRRQKGLQTSDVTLHSVFYGSPGTGKTTVARVYGKMLKALGLLERGHLVETDRAGLVANYVGQTANKTDEKIREAIGGVLFIDEAYSLHKGDHSQWDYGSEAIEILLKRMEDHRDNFAVIVAGYPEPMNEFLSSNEGFRSRFANFIHFEDFTPEELMEILKLLFEQNDYVMTRTAAEIAKVVIESAHQSRDKSFGNARFCRNLFERTIRNQAVRVAETVAQPTERELTYIVGLDVLPDAR